MVFVVAALFLYGAICAPGASASDSFTFIGRGNGHGVGMSQWGAWQGAREGYSFADILAFYYPGTTLEPTDRPDAVLRVRISSTPWTSNTSVYSQVALEATVSPAVLYMSPGGETREIPVGKAVTMVNKGGRVHVSIPGESLGPCDWIELRPSGTGSSEGRVKLSLTLGGGSEITPREYWGVIRVQCGDGAGDLWVYNFVALEKYVRSIAEVDYDWGTVGGAFYAPEAVKAQAVASRSYALAQEGTLADNWADQCYRGYTFEAKYPGIAQAADDTAGLVLTYGGRPISAFFSGHSGGYTTDSAWSGSVPSYIVAKADPWSLRAPPAGTGNGPGWSWKYTISAQGLSDKVNGKLKDASGRTVGVGLIREVRVASRDTADADSHARTLLITGDSGAATVSVASFRSLIGASSLPSTLIVGINGDSGAGTGAPGPGTGPGAGVDPGPGTDPDPGPGSDPGGPTLGAGEFYDVGPGHLYRDQIRRVVTGGLLSGYSNDFFRPEGAVTRSQFAKIAVNLYNVMHPDTPIKVTNVTTRPFEDVAVDSKTLGDASDWIAAAKKAGLVAGITPDTFAPSMVIRRDQMATMMCRALGCEEKAGALGLDTPGFSDVPPGSVHWGAATYLKQKGIILGYLHPTDPGATLLRVDEPIKRQHVAVILCRVLDLVP